jgi:hypothetical protein
MKKLNDGVLLEGKTHSLFVSDNGKTVILMNNEEGEEFLTGKDYKTSSAEPVPLIGGLTIVEVTPYKIAEKGVIAKMFPTIDQEWLENASFEQALEEAIRFMAIKANPYYDGAMIRVDNELVKHYAPVANVIKYDGSPENIMFFVSGNIYNSQNEKTGNMEVFGEKPIYFLSLK